MTRAIIVAPSILSADFSKLSDEIKRAESAGADWLHIDVMDGHFVPNITVGPVIIESIRKLTHLKLDIHLMIDEPQRYIRQFATAGADIITFHAETTALDRIRVNGEKGAYIREGGKLDMRKTKDIIDIIRDCGKKVGIAINPATQASAILDIVNSVDLVLIMTVWPGFGGQQYIDDVTHKIDTLSKFVDKKWLEVDGGIDIDTAKRAISAGANVIVAGTATFRAEDMRKVIKNIRDYGI